jgi:hypothetical protein
MNGSKPVILIYIPKNNLKYKKIISIYILYRFQTKMIYLDLVGVRKMPNNCGWVSGKLFGSNQGSCSKKIR